jgi:hypothetical protein
MRGALALRLGRRPGRVSRDEQHEASRFQTPAATWRYAEPVAQEGGQTGFGRAGADLPSHGLRRNSREAGMRLGGNTQDSAWTKLDTKDCRGLVFLTLSRGSLGYL